MQASRGTGKGDGMNRYAIYWAPDDGPFADRAAAWLGWDAGTGTTVPHPDIAGLPRPLADLTAEPRKYGFHGTIRAPFRLAEGVDEAMLYAACDALGARLRHVAMPRLALEHLDGFLALTPEGDTGPILALGAEVVRATDPLRSTLTPAEVARRRPDSLSPRQRDLLMRWGYPYVMEEFRFHLTLTGPLAPEEAPAVREAAAAWLAPVLPQPFILGSLCLFGEDGAGRFHRLHRFPLPD